MDTLKKIGTATWIKNNGKTSETVAKKYFLWYSWASMKPT